MATLEKIRSKSVMLIVFIGVALLAFIIGDFLNSGRSIFGTGRTVAKVDGKSIDVTEYQNRVQQQSTLYQQQGRKIDAAQLNQQVLNAMISETLFNAETERLGLVVTDNELTDIMLGRGAQMLSGRIAQESGGQIPSIGDLHAMITRPAEFGLPHETVVNLQNYWKQLERETAEQMVQQKFMNLFSGALTANKLDAEAFYQENAAPTRIAYVKKDFGQLPDDDFEVTTEEINAEWAKNKNAYKLDEETRSVNYITVAIVPSAADLMAGQQRVEDALTALRTSDDAGVLSDMTDFVVDNRTSVASTVRDRSLKSFLDSASVGRAEVISRGANDYTIVKLTGRSNQVDSVNINFIAVQGKAAFDSVFTALKGGASLNDFADNKDVMGINDSIWVSMQGPEGAQLRELFADRAAGIYFTPDTAADAQGGRIYRIRTRRAPVPVYNYTYVTYSIDPSEATINKLEADLTEYLHANPTAEAFATKAIEAGYQVFPANVTASTPSLNNIEDSRAAIVWALNAKKGQVSPIFGNEQTGRLIAVAVNDIYDDFIPARDPRVKDYLTAQVRNNKKGEKLLADYAGKASDLAGYAAVMGTQVDTTNINFGQQMVSGFSLNESELQASAAVAPEHQTMGPIKANNSVVVFEVLGTDAPARPYSFEEASQTFNGSRGAYRLANAIQQILLGNKKVTNNLAKFFSHE